MVGMNFERPNDLNSISELHMGYYDFGEVRNGEAGVNYYENIGQGQWALMLEDMQYDNQFVEINYGGKMALIDSGNTTI